MDDKQLNNYWAVYEQQKTTAMENKAYTEGKNPTILKGGQSKNPDNRIPVPLAKMAVEDMVGYAGRAGDRVTGWELDKNEDEDNQEALNKKDEYTDLMTTIFAYNDEEVETSELYNDSQVFGEYAEILWVSDELSLPSGIMTPEFKRVDPYKVLIQYDDSLKPKKLFGLYFWVAGDKSYIDIYYPLYKESYSKPKDKSTWSLDEELTEYPYSNVPVIKGRANREGYPLFNAEKPLIDAHDNLLSKSVNEVDRFNALITLFPGKITKELKDKLQEIAVIDNLAIYDADKFPKYLEKNLSGVSDFYTGLADRLERLYRESIKVPNFADENFAGNQSGIAMSYKLLGIEFKASQIDTYFNKGLYERVELINDVINAGTSSIDTEEYKTVIKEHRNLPIDELAKLEIATAMLGVGISKDTIIKFLPNSIIKDVEKELAKLTDDDEEIIKTDDI